MGLRCLCEEEKGEMRKEMGEKMPNVRDASVSHINMKETKCFRFYIQETKIYEWINSVF